MRILLADDHGIVREGTALLLKSLDPAIEVVHARSAGECLMRAGEQGIDLVLLDLGLPDRPGLETLAALKQEYPEMPVIVLSAREDRDSVLESIRLGAMGFIPKSSENPQLLSHALGMAVAGAVMVPASVTRKSGQAPTAAPSRSAPGTNTPPPNPALSALGLTARQVDVLRLLVQGLPNKSIARKLDIAETTARGYVSMLLAAFGVSNRTGLVVEVARRGLLLGGTGEDGGPR